MRLLIEPAYRQVSNEDGQYQSFCGYNVIAVYVVDNEIEYTDVYTGGDKYAAFVFGDYNEAVRFADSIECIDDIDPDLWFGANSRRINDLPDYATNPHRPEYN